MELVLGAAAAAVSQLFTIPVSVIATRQQLGAKPTPDSPRTYQLAHAPRGASPLAATRRRLRELWLELVHDEESIVGVTRDIYREDGVTGFWRGLKPSLVLCANPAITYGVFERVKNVVLAASGDVRMTPGKSFLVGALAKSLATVITFPYILAKIRLQARNTQFDSAWRLLLHTARTGGLRAWYHGMQAQITKAVISQALLFWAREYLEIWTRTLLAITGAPK